MFANLSGCVTITAKWVAWNVTIHNYMMAIPNFHKKNKDSKSSLEIEVQFSLEL